MAEIAPGVYQLKVPIPNNPLENTNVYLIRGDNDYALIDAGWNNEAVSFLHYRLPQPAAMTNQTCHCEE